MIHAARGEVNAALTWLDRAVEQRDAGTGLAYSEPMFRSLHADPRWSVFLRKLGFEARGE